jgi:hypothetical protein
MSANAGLFPERVENVAQERIAADRNSKSNSASAAHPEAVRGSVPSAEWLESPLCSRGLTTRRMREDAPLRPLPAPPHNRAVGCGQLVIRFDIPEDKNEVSYLHSPTFSMPQAVFD